MVIRTVIIEEGVALFQKAWNHQLPAGALRLQPNKIPSCRTIS